MNIPQHHNCENGLVSIPDDLKMNIMYGIDILPCMKLFLCLDTSLYSLVNTRQFWWVIKAVRIHHKITRLLLLCRIEVLSTLDLQTFDLHTLLMIVCSLIKNMPSTLHFRQKLFSTLLYTLRLQFLNYKLVINQVFVIMTQSSLDKDISKVLLNNGTIECTFRFLKSLFPSSPSSLKQSRSEKELKSISSLTNKYSPFCTSFSPLFSSSLSSTYSFQPSSTSKSNEALLPEFNGLTVMRNFLHFLHNFSICGNLYTTEIFNRGGLNFFASVLPHFLSFPPPPPDFAALLSSFYGKFTYRGVLLGTMYLSEKLILSILKMILGVVLGMPKSQKKIRKEMKKRYRIVDSMVEKEMIWVLVKSIERSMRMFVKHKESLKSNRYQLEKKKETHDLGGNCTYGRKPFPTAEDGKLPCDEEDDFDWLGAEGEDSARGKMHLITTATQLLLMIASYGQMQWIDQEQGRQWPYREGGLHGVRPVSDEEWGATGKFAVVKVRLANVYHAKFREGKDTSHSEYFSEVMASVFTEFYPIANGGMWSTSSRDHFRADENDTQKGLERNGEKNANDFLMVTRQLNLNVNKKERNVNISIGAKVLRDMRFIETVSNCIKDVFAGVCGVDPRTGKPLPPLGNAPALPTSMHSDESPHFYSGPFSTSLQNHFFSPGFPPVLEGFLRTMRRLDGMPHDDVHGCGDKNEEKKSITKERTRLLQENVYFPYVEMSRDVLDGLEGEYSLNL